MFFLTLKLSFYPIIYFNSEISTINPILYLTTLSLYAVGLLYHVSEVIISSVWSNFSIFKAGLGLDANFPHTMHYIPLSNCKIFNKFCNLLNIAWFLWKSERGVLLYCYSLRLPNDSMYPNTIGKKSEINIKRAQKIISW